ncbi:DNA ligase [bioreactor metagenome]|uniref:DNA ligase (NAD(+)) n=1 Tax=bioreactor metagenome TaxID=1076179 RepID=A0A644T7A9_9ZZZZ|nr:NAD-dependent DNA ligase LigA [Candidatus Elulimicrobiales bacterium]
MKNSEKDVKQRIIDLRKLIEKHQHLYHVLDNPEIEDSVYDTLFEELLKLEKENPEFQSENSPSNRIGGKILDKFEKVKHEVKQWSYDDAFSFEELKKWEERNLRFLEKENLKKTFSYISELKIDGLKVVLTYENGILVRGATRGDGEIGEDITENVKMIKSIPLKLKENISLTVMGEAWIKKSDLEKINNEQDELGLTKYANTRNLAAGTLRQLDTSVVAKRNLKLFAYDIEGGDFKNQEEELVFLKKNNFLVNDDYKVCDNLEEVEKMYEAWKNKRESEEFGIDGLVVKINEREIDKRLGFTAKSPRGGIAYKFPAEEVSTKVLGITIQIGRTGVATPVAELEEVLVYGSRVKRATLHNSYEIERLDVRVGDTVIVRKAGDVIPEIVSVIKELRPKNSQKFKMPTNCPVCNSKLEREENKVNKSGFSTGLFCKNSDCEAKHREYFSYFVSKKAFNIDGMGEKIVDEFYDLGLIKNVLDIFKLKKEDIEGLEGFGEKSAENLINAIEKSKNIPLHKFIFSLGIRQIGETTAKDLVKKFKTFENLQNKVLELIKERKSKTIVELKEIFGVEGIGEKSLESLMDYFEDKKNKEFLRKILNIIFLENLEEKEEGKNGILQGKVFVITGALSKPREEFQGKIESLQGKVSSSVSKKTDYLLLGENEDGKISTKEKTARELGIKIINEEEFNKLIK